MIISKDFGHLLSGKEVSVCLMMKLLDHMSKWSIKRTWAENIITILPRFG